MKINTINHPHHATVNDVRDSRKAQAPAQNKAPESSVQLQPSAAQSTSQDIDTARVDSIRQAISEGHLKLDTGRIADGIIASARELLGEQ